MKIKDLGAVIAVIALAAGGLIAWGQASAKIDAHETRLSKVENGLDDIAKSLYRIEGALGTKKDGDK